MGSRNDFAELADGLRSLRGPEAGAGFDVTTNQLTVRTRVWSGGLRGLGTTTDTDVVVNQKYPIREVSSLEIAGSGGRYEQGDLKVGPITPAWVDGAQSGGFTTAQLNPTGADGTEIIYLIVGSHPGEYQLIDLSSSRAFSYFLILGRRRTTP